MTKGMKLIGPVIFVVSLVLLSLGYAASQWARLFGDFKDYAESVDVAPVKAASLVLLIACVILPFVNRRGEESNS
jgi:uncharacterized membrane protein YidH (DUF202 family)